MPYGVLSVATAVAKLSNWLSSREGVARVARHLGCEREDAELRIVGKAKAGLIKARGEIKVRSVNRVRGVIEDRQVSPLPAAWHGTIDLVGTTMRPPSLDADSSYEIANLELCFIDLVATRLLLAPAEKKRQPAEEAIAYLVKGVPLPWKEWQGAGASSAEIEQAEIDLGELIGADQVTAWGEDPATGRRKRIPSRDFRDEKIENRALPVSVARPPKVVVDCRGYVTTSPRQRSANYKGRRWENIEVDAAALRQARPRPSTAQVEQPSGDPAPAASAALPAAPPPEPEQPAPAARAGEPRPEPVPAVEPVSSGAPPTEPPQSPQVEPEPPPVKSARRGYPPQYDWDEGFRFMRRELNNRGDPIDPANAGEKWRSDADVARLVAAYIAIGDGPDFKHTARVIRPKLKEWRAEQAERNGA